MKEEILANLDKTGKPRTSFLKENNIHIQEAYDIVYSQKKCRICSDIARFISYTKGYAEYCGRKCSQKHKWNDKSKQSGNESRKIYWENNQEKRLEVNKKISKTNKIVWGSDTCLRKRQTEKLNFKEIISKGRKTKLEKYGLENPWSFGTDRYKNTIIEKYGVDNARLIEGMTERIQNTFNEKYGVNNSISLPGVREKTIETKRVNYMKKIYSLSSLDAYYKLVSKFTKMNDLTILENFNNRGRSGVNGAYQLDHKFSIIEGYINGILPCYIGNISNLEFIPWKDNIAKRHRCSITLDELIEGFNND